LRPLDDVSGGDDVVGVNYKSASNIGVSIASDRLDLDHCVLYGGVLGRE
jgi:hypothetical protein